VVVGNQAESMAIAKGYGRGPCDTGLKIYMGHTMGSGGVIETTITLYMMEKGSPRHFFNSSHL